MADFATFLTRLEAQEEVRGAGFERACKWLLENVPEYVARLERVWLWADWPGRGGRIDAGIDLVAKERGGGLWAVQAKHYDPQYAIKKSDLDSFLSESSRRAFTYRLLIATTDHLGATARRTLDGQEKPVGTLLRSDLEVLGVPWPDGPGDLRPARMKPKRPRPHQRRAVRDILAGFRSGDRGQVVMACGTGKTLVARVLHDQLGSRRTLVVVPSLSLLKQSLREWLAAGTLEYLAVCSDETVTPDDADAVVSSTGELGVPVTTDPAQIGAFLRARGGGVAFATYQSSPQIAAAHADGAPAFDLVVADEAHRCAGPQAGVFATVLDAAKIKARKRVFMTATPRYFTGRVKKAALDADWEVASMDDEAKFGPVLHRLAFAEAIDRDLLCDYQVLVVGVSDSSYRQMAERGAFVTTDGETISDARTLARQIGTLRAMRNHDLHRIVSFHARIDNATRFATSVVDVARWMPDALRPTGELWAEHVSGRMTSGERETRLNRLRAVGSEERGVLTNARCLSEGVDVPTLDAVAFIDPRRSQVDVVQAVGRAIRKADDKSIGTVIIPVFVDEHADPEAVLAASEFDRVWQIVRALRDHDDVLADELDDARRQLGRRGTVGERPGKIVLDLPDTVGVDFARAFDTRLVDSTTTSWEHWFGLLERFATREGHTRIPASYVEDGHRLGKWVSKQRAAHGAGRTSAERIGRLEALPGWLWDPWDANWEVGFSQVERFATREGHTRVPASYVEDGYRLGAWVTTQRAVYRKGQLPAERISRLEALPGWVWDPFGTDWEVGFSHLERFATREGHTRISQEQLEDGYRLGTWVTKQRAGYRAGRLSGERAARLEALPGWVWNPRDADWEAGFSHLEWFATREGHTRVPASYVEDGYRLGQWVGTQRAGYRAGRLSGERAARLEALPGWDWDPFGTDWENGFSHLERFATREGHTRVPAGYVEDGYRLGQWVKTQCVTYRAGRLSGERAARLKALPGWNWGTPRRPST
jgi:superfamily II DNA or RNA helicase